MINGNCRGKCTYCYAGGIQRVAMPPEILADVARHMGKGGKTAWCSIIGGEPLHDPDQALRAIETLRRGCDKMSMTTSLPHFKGWRRILKALKRAGVYLTVSVDGPASIHDKQRLAHPHAEVMNKLAFLKRIEWPARNIRATLDPTIFPGKLPLVDFVLGTREVAWDAGAQMFSLSLNAGANAVVPPANAFAEMDEAIAQYRQLPIPIWHQLWLVNQRRNKMYLSPKPSCGSGCSMLAVEPDGTLWPCHRMAGRPVGNIQTGIDTASMRQWWNEVCQRRASCVQCAEWDTCRGACAAEDLYDKVNETACRWWRALIAAHRTSRALNIETPESLSGGDIGEDRARRRE